MSSVLLRSKCCMLRWENANQFISCQSLYYVFFHLLFFVYLLILVLQGSPSHTPSKNTSGPTFSLSPAIRGIQDSPSTSINPIGSLQEMCMKNNWTPPIYDVIHEVGEAHMKTFIYECKVLVYLFVKL